MSNLGVASSSLAMGGGSLVPTLTFLVIYFKIVRIGQKERFQERSFLKRFFLCQKRSVSQHDVAKRRNRKAQTYERRQHVLQPSVEMTNNPQNNEHVFVLQYVMTSNPQNDEHVFVLITLLFDFRPSFVRLTGTTCARFISSISFVFRCRRVEHQA